MTIKSFKWGYLALLLCLSCISPVIAKEMYPFENKASELRFIELSKQYRCVVCQNQSLMDSNAPMAMDLKSVIYQKVSHLESDEQIRDYLTERFGDMIIYEPPVQSSTFLLWGFPIFGFLFILGVWFNLIRRGRSFC